MLLDILLVPILFFIFVLGKMLIVDIHEDLTVRKQAFLMTQLLQKYLAYLPAHIPNSILLPNYKTYLKYITAIQSLYSYSADRGSPT